MRITRNRLQSVAVALIAALAVSGCIDDNLEQTEQGIFSDTSLSGGGADDTQIREFAINTSKVDGAYPLSVNTQYRFGWDVRYGSGVELSLYLSPSDTVADPEADLMYVCDEQAFPGSCRQSVECLYDNSNVLQCTGGRPVDVSRRLFERSHLILKVSSQHNKTRDQATKTMAVELY